MDEELVYAPQPAKACDCVTRWQCPADPCLDHFMSCEHSDIIGLGGTIDKLCCIADPFFPERSIKADHSGHIKGRCRECEQMEQSFNDEHPVGCRCEECR